jgi:hypothetical protein
MQNNKKTAGTLKTDNYSTLTQTKMFINVTDKQVRSFAVINLRGVSTNKTIIYFIAMQTYKELIRSKSFRVFSRNVFCPDAGYC